MENLYSLFSPDLRSKQIKNGVILKLHYSVFYTFLWFFGEVLQHSQQKLAVSMLLYANEIFMWHAFVAMITPNRSVSLERNSETHRELDPSRVPLVT